MTVETRPSVPPGTTHPSCAIHPASLLLAVEPGTSLIAVAPDLSSVVYHRDPYSWSGPVVHHLATGTRTTVTGSFLGYSAGGRTALFIVESAASKSVLEIDPPMGRVHEIAPGQVEHASLVDKGRVLLLSGRDANTWVYFPETRQLLLASPLPTAMFDETDPRPMLFTVKTPSGAVIVDGVAHALVPLPTAVVTGIGTDRLLWMDASGAGRVWERGRPALRLGQWNPAEGLAPQALDGSLELVIDGIKDAWLWDVPAHTARLVASGVDRGALTQDGRTTLLVRGGELVQLDLATGSKKSLGGTTHWMFPIPSADGRRAAFIDAADEEAPRTLHLLDVVGGREVPLPTVVPMPRFDLGPDLHGSFHRKGSLLYVYDGTERILDAASGRELLATDRADEGSEGVKSYWGPGDDRFYTRVGAYLRDFTPQYVWDANTGRETFIGDGVAVHCQFAGRDVFADGVVGDDASVPHRLTSWDYVADRRWTISPRVTGRPTCLERGALFREGDVLAYGDLAVEATRTVGVGVRSVVVEGGEVVFNDDAGICAVPVGKL